MSETATPKIEVSVNGEARSIPGGSSVLDLLGSLGIAPDRVAVELDRKILKKDFWGSTRLAGGEQFEIVHFVGGG